MITTYFLGAGASAHGIPVVNELTQCFKKFVNQSRMFESTQCGMSLGKFALQMAEDLQVTRSVDTLARSYFLSGDEKSYNNLKFCLDLFISYLSINGLHTQSYTGFEKRPLGILSDLIRFQDRKLPSNVDIISWNYDNLFELAEIDIFGLESESKLNFLKLNGSCLLTDFMRAEKKDRRSLRDNSDRFEVWDQYYEYMKASKEKIIRFSWERKEGLDKLKVAREKIQKTSNLVIIGYSFPFYNRYFDKQIFSCLHPYARLFIQDPKFNLVKDELKHLFGSIPSLQGLDEIFLQELQNIPADNNPSYFIPHSFDPDAEDITDGNSQT